MDVIEKTPSLARVRRDSGEIVRYERTKKKNGADWNRAKKPKVEHSPSTPLPALMEEVLRRELVEATIAMIKADIANGPFDREDLESVVRWTEFHEQNEGLTRDEAAKRAILAYFIHLLPPDRSVEEGVEQAATLIKWRRSRFAKWLGAGPYHPRPEWIAGKKQETPDPEQKRDAVDEWWDRFKKSYAGRKGAREAALRDAWLFEEDD